MRLTLALAALLSASPAEACHHYTHWAYPWPQRCGGGLERHAAFKVIPEGPTAEPVVVKAPEPDMPLPTMDATWAAAPPDPETEGRLKLRGYFEEHK